MLNYLFIAEKPSLAKEIAEARAEQKGIKAVKSNGYWSVGDDAVTWLFGHMYEQAPPQAYDPKYEKWNLDDLPIIPEKWKLLVSKDKKDHISGIKTLLQQAKFVVNAGDAAREGQLLVDEVLIENKWNPFDEKTFRLWVRSVARKDLLDALNSMLPNSEKQFLYNSAICRQRADWLHGMNLSRLYTIKARQSGAEQVVSVGRVQTPTLKIVVDRDREIDNFKPVDHYLPAAIFVHENGKFQATWIIPEDCEGLDSEGRLIDPQVAKKVVDRILGKTGKVESFKSTDKSTAPPLPYSLSALQTECSAKFGLSAQETLDVAQRLYEQHKVTTYPRSDSRHLPLSILKDEAPQIMNNLKKVDGIIGEAASKSNMMLKSSAWDDSKVSDHHGIIPTVEATASKISQITGVDRKVFDLIAKAFISQFYPAMRYKSLSAVVGVNADRFKASGRSIVDLGWKTVYGAEADDSADEEDNQTLPVMKNNDPVSIQGSEVQSKRTTPPPRFTDGTLIAAMTNIHRFVSDSEIKKKLKENDGLGTEATRASIIETLIRRNFLTRKGKNQLISSDVGKSVIDVLPDPIVDPGLTAIWESYLDQVSKGSLSPEKFLAGQIQSLTKRIMEGKDASIKIKGAKPSVPPIEGHGTKCPKCGSGELLTRMIQKGEHKGKKYLSCTRRPDCDYIQWPKPNIKPIEGHGETCPTCKQGKLVTREIMKGDNKGKKFLSCDRYPECKHSQWPQPKAVDGHGKKCPKCHEGELVTRQSKTGKTFLSCNKYPACDHSEWPQEKIPPLSGDGELCSVCGKGHMVTKVVQKGEHKGKKFLSCNAYPDCKNTIWPENQNKGKTSSSPANFKKPKSAFSKK